MPVPKLSDIADEYSNLFKTCIINPKRAAEVETIVSTISQNQARYQGISDSTSVPWFVIAVIHNMECGLDFTEHLHNGDSLKRRTVNEPSGRPTQGNPPFTFEFSAQDALAYDGLTTWKDWSIAGVCYKLEGYNGWGYRWHEINTPYLWSGSQHYTSGKFVSDGVWSDTAVSKQIGAGVILRRMAEKSLISFDDAAPPVPSAIPVVAYSNSLPASPDDVQIAKNLQTWLNTHDGIFVKVDGVPGDKTSEAFKAVTGHYLPGDPREDA